MPYSRLPKRPSNHFAPANFSARNPNPETPNIRQMQSAAQQSECILENYAFIPIYLRARVEDWELHFADLSVGDRLDAEQIAHLHKASWRGTAVVVKTPLSAAKTSCNIDEAHVSTDGDILERLLLLEIDAISRLRHPSIVTFLGACFEGPAGHVLLVREMIAGGTLAAVLAAGRAAAGPTNREVMWAPPRRQAVGWALQTAQALNYMHQCEPRVAHGDLGPACLMLTGSGQLKVSGFSFCAVLPGPATAQRGTLFDPDGGWTDTAERIGLQEAAAEERARIAHSASLRYAAPERTRAAAVCLAAAAAEATCSTAERDQEAEDEEVVRGWDERADVYSLALIIWELCAGEPPLAHLDDQAAAAAAADLGARPGNGAGGEVPWAGLAGLVRRGWAADAGLRCTADEVVSALQALADADGRLGVGAHGPEAGCGCTVA